MRRRTHIHTRVRGFTLLELLVVIAILTLIMTASFGALRLGSKSFAAGVIRADATEQIRAASDMLRRQFSQLLPIVHESDGETISSFMGDNERIQFIAPAPRSAGSAGLFVYSIFSRASASGQQLMLAYAAYDPGQESFDYRAASVNRVLIDSLLDIEFSYFGAADPDDRPMWQDRWIAEDGNVPDVIRISPTLADDEMPCPGLSFVIRAGGLQ